METNGRSVASRNSRDVYVDDHELQSAYKSVSEEYTRKAEAMLRLAAGPHGAEEFHQASEEVEALGARIRELRTLLLMRLSAPRTDQGTSAHEDGD